MIQVAGMVILCACGTTVFVKDSKGVPVDGATVYIVNAENPFERVPVSDPQDRTTKDKGRVEFANIELSYNVVKVVVQFEGRTTVERVPKSGGQFPSLIPVELPNWRRPQSLTLYLDE